MISNYFKLLNNIFINYTSDGKKLHRSSATLIPASSIAGVNSYTWLVNVFDKKRRSSSLPQVFIN